MGFHLGGENDKNTLLVDRQSVRPSVRPESPVGMEGREGGGGMGDLGEAVPVCLFVSVLTFFISTFCSCN